MQPPPAPYGNYMGGKNLNATNFGASSDDDEDDDDDELEQQGFMDNQQQHAGTFENDMEEDEEESAAVPNEDDAEEEEEEIVAASIEDDDDDENSQDDAGRAVPPTTSSSNPLSDTCAMLAPPTTDAERAELQQLQSECGAMMKLLQQLRAKEATLHHSTRLVAREAIQCGFQLELLQAPETKKRGHRNKSLPNKKPKTAAAEANE